MIITQFHSMEKRLSYNFIGWKKIVSCYFHTILGIKRLMKKLKFQFQSMEKMLALKIHSMVKCLFCYFHTLNFGL